MKLKRGLNPRVGFATLYVLAFAVYIIVGLQPVGAADYEISAQLEMPGVGLTADVTKLELNDGKLDTPDTIAGSYTQEAGKTLLIGHSTTVFAGLDEVKLNDSFSYDGKSYRVVAIDMVRKAAVDMEQVLAGAEKDTVVIMTCAGQLLEGGDATHRLMVTAVAE